jgi:hypothetical protein
MAFLNIPDDINLEYLPLLGQRPDCVERSSFPEVWIKNKNIPVTSTSSYFVQHLPTFLTSRRRYKEVQCRPEAECNPFIVRHVA